MAYENERLVGFDDLNMVPNKRQALNYKDYSWMNKSSRQNITARLTTTDTEALIEIPRRNINASGIKKGTKNGLGNTSLFG